MTDDGGQRTDDSISYPSSVVCPPSSDESEYAQLYNLDAAQIAWRRQKIAELKSADLFRQEYPANAAEAFQMSGHDSFIPAPLFARARKANGDLISVDRETSVGLDIAEQTAAKTALQHASLTLAERLLPKIAE